MGDPKCPNCQATLKFVNATTDFYDDLIIIDICNWHCPDCKKNYQTKNFYRLYKEDELEEI